jgi:transposase-like protein
VFYAYYLWEKKMAEDHRRSDEKLLQALLLEEPEFLRQIVERVLQEMLEAEMTEHIGAAPYPSEPTCAPGSATATSRGL